MSELNLHDLIEDAADTEVDMNEAQAGGEYTPPAAGRAGLRFVTYIELGKQEGQYQGKPKVSDRVVLGFEVFGPKWPLDENGKAPYIEFEMNKALNDKAGFYKVFKAMNWEGKAKIMAQLLGKEFIGTIIHRKYKRRDGKEGIAVEFYNKEQQVYTIGMPFVEDMDSGESVRRTVPPATREQRLFIWSKPHKLMWDSIFIDGEWPERKDEKTGEVTHPAKSKNKFQLAIKAAKNFPGSPAAALLDGVDDELLNESARKTPEEAIAAKKSAAAGKDTARTETASAGAVEPAASKRASTKKSDAKPKADEPAKLPDPKPDSAGADDSDDDTDDELNDLPF